MTIKDYIISNNDFYIDDSICYFDIETLGFDRKRHAVILICAAYKHQESVLIRQYFADTEDDERVVLQAFKDDIENIKKVITFNGDAFDIPFLIARYSYYDMDNILPQIKSYDMLKFIRPLKSIWGLENLKLKTVEQFFGIKREDQIDGAQSIRLYYEYLRTQDNLCKSDIMLHNYEDVKHMLILQKLIIHHLDTQTFDLNVYNQIPENHMIPVYLYKITFKKNLMNIELNSSLTDLSLQIYTNSGHSLIGEKDKIHAKIYISSGIDEKGCSINYIKSEDIIIPLSIDKLIINENIIKVLNILFL